MDAKHRDNTSHLVRNAAAETTTKRVDLSSTFSFADVDSSGCNLSYWANQMGFCWLTTSGWTRHDKRCSRHAMVAGGKNAAAKLPNGTPAGLNKRYNHGWYQRRVSCGSYPADAIGSGDDHRTAPDDSVELTRVWQRLILCETFPAEPIGDINPLRLDDCRASSEACTQPLEIEAMNVRFVDSNDNWTQFQIVGDITNTAISGTGSGPLAPLDLPDDKLTKHILFDLSDATFLDSSGIGWLLSVNRAAKEQGFLVVVHSVPPLIQRVFGMMKLSQVIPLVENFDEAQNRIASVS